MQYLVLSNNASLENPVQNIKVMSVKGGLSEFYETMGELLQNGYELVSSLLPPNVPLIRSPVRSVILKKNNRKYDANGLICLEKAKERTATLGVAAEDRLRKDQEFIDRDLLLRAIEQLEALGLRETTSI